MQLFKIITILLFFLSQSKLIFSQLYNDFLKVYNKNNKLHLIEVLNSKLSFEKGRFMYLYDNDSTFFYDVKNKNLVLLQKDTIQNKTDTLLLNLTNKSLTIIEKGKIQPILFSDTFKVQKSTNENLVINNLFYTWGNWLLSGSQSNFQNFILTINNIKKKKYIEIIRNKGGKAQKFNFWEIVFKESDKKFISTYAPNGTVIDFQDEKYTAIMFGKRDKNIFRNLSTHLTGKYMYLDNSYQLRYNLFNKLNKKKSKGINITNL